MKKILILAYDFPPYVSVGGLRPYCWYKYLSVDNFSPIVITRQWSNSYGNQLDYIAPGESPNTIIEESETGTILRAPYFPNLANRLMLKYGERRFNFLRRFITAYYEIFQFFFLIGTKSQLYFTADNYIKKNKVDVIIASGDPFILFKYASKLGKKYNIPWIADYRDPWTKSIKDTKWFVYQRFNSFLEKRIVKSARLIITVSEFVQEKIQEQLKNQKIYIIPNGYDPDAIIDAQKSKQENTSLNISIVGTIYKYHPIESVFAVMSAFVKQNPNARMKLNLYGVNISAELEVLISAKFPLLKPVVQFISKIPNHEYLRELSRNNVMLLFNQYSYMGTKIYDYIALNRLILFCYSDDDDAKKLKEKYYDFNEEKDQNKYLQEELIRNSDAGHIIQNALHLEKVLNNLYEEFTANGFISSHSKNHEKFSRKEQTKLLAEIITNSI